MPARAPQNAAGAFAGLGACRVPPEPKAALRPSWESPVPGEYVAKGLDGCHFGGRLRSLAHAGKRRDRVLATPGRDLAHRQPRDGRCTQPIPTTSRRRISDPRAIAQRHAIAVLALAAGVTLLIAVWTVPPPPSFEARWQPVSETLLRHSEAACSWLQDCTAS